MNGADIFWAIIAGIMVIWGAWAWTKPGKSYGDYSFDMTPMFRVALWLFALIVLILVYGGIYWW